MHLRKTKDRNLFDISKQRNMRKLRIVKLNRLIFWQCLMLAKDEIVWSKIEYGNLSNLQNDINKHKKSQSHIFSDLQFKTF